MGRDDAFGIVAKIVRAWAPLFAIVVPALGVMALGALQLAGWLVDPRWLIRTAGAPTMLAATAAGMVLAAAGLFAAYFHSRRSTRARYAAAGVLAVLALAAALGVVAMPPPTIGCFLVTAVLLFAFDRPDDRGRAVVIQLLAGALLAVGAISLIVHDLVPEGLFSGYRAGLMAAPSAACFIAIGVAFLGLIARSPWYEAVYANREDEKILILALGIFCLVLLGTGTAGFASTQRNLEAMTHRMLLQAVRDRAQILESRLAGRVTRAATFASNPTFGAALARRDPRTLEEEAGTYLEVGFTGIAFFDDLSRPVALVGRPAWEPRLELEVAGQEYDTRLVWSDRYLLRVIVPIRRGAEVVGWVRTEQELDMVGRLQANAAEMGRTAEWMLCGARDEKRMDCLPQRFQTYPWTGDRRIADHSHPVDRALRGERGVALADDHDGRRVIAGYAPVADTGLGVVLKVATTEFYGPLREQLSGWWRWFLATALIGTLLVSSQVRPVAQRLVMSENLARTRADALARSEAALRELYRNLADGILVFTPAGRIVFANPAAERIFGYAPGSLAGRDVTPLIPPELHARNLASTRRFVADGTSNVLGRGTLVFPAVRADGSRFDVEFSISSMGRDEELRLVGVFRDVSERRALERMKGEFVATVSHELRTPLTSIVGALELVRENDALPQPERDFIDMAWRNSHRLAALVNDIIDTERMESGELQLELAPLDLAPFLAEAVQMNQAYAATHHVFFYLEPVPDLRVAVDRGRLMQVMANLLSNAAKFSPEHEEVRVRAADEGNAVRIEVADRGPGIPPEFRDRIFTRFAQADASDSRGKGGTGLGLAIAKGWVERMGGTIGFDTAVGRGTTFWFELPKA